MAEGLAANSRVRTIVVVGLILLGAGAWLLFFTDTEQTAPVEVPALEAISNAAALDLPVAPEQGALAPDFALVTLEGEDVQLADLRGQPVVINFWATWCAPCRLEMPAVQSRFEKHADDGLIVLAVNFDEPAGPVQGFVDELGLTFTILLDPGASVQELYRQRSYPSTFFVDADGVIQVQHIGVMTEGQLDENLAQIGLEFEG